MTPNPDVDDLEPPNVDTADIHTRGMARIAALFDEAMGRRDGRARQATWEAEDGWIIMWTTGRVVGGPFHDKFAVYAYKPVGKGARSGRGRAAEHVAVYRRGFATRKAAKRRALVLYRQHSPKWHAAHPERPNR